jgi:hypothetical protein
MCICMHMHMSHVHAHDMHMYMCMCMHIVCVRATHAPRTGHAHTLHCAITRSGLETMNIGAAIMGARREPKSLAAVADEAMLRTPTPERDKRLRVGLHIIVAEFR